MENYIKILLEQLVSWLPRVGVAILMLMFFWLLIKLLSRLIASVAERLEIDANLVMLFVRAAG